MLKTFLLALKLIWQDLRAGQWWIIFFSLILAVTVITGVRFYSDRLSQGIERQSAALLGGDLVISSPTPIPISWIQKANSLKLKSAEVWIYPTVVSANNQLQLVNIQAVSSSYPLIADTPFTFNPHKILVEPRLLSALAIKAGDKVTIGAMPFQTQGFIPSDVDMLNTGFIIAPRILMHLEDVPLTRTVLPGSRVDYRLLLTGNASSVQTFRQWIAPNLTASQQLLDVNSQRFTLSNALTNITSYIQLVLLFCLLMSGVAIALSTKQYLTRHYSQIALWRCLGAEKKQLILIFVWQLASVAFFAAVIGLLIGFILQEWIADLFKNYIRFSLPPPTFSAVGLGFATSFFLLFSYAYPVISELPDISPLYLWRNEVTQTARKRNRYFIIAVGFLLIYVYWAMDFSLLALFFLDALLLSIGFLFILSVVALSGVKKIRDYTDGSLRRGLSQLINYPENTSTQLTAFTLILIALFVLSSLRYHLLENWQQTLPKNTPNYFAFNIAPADVPNLTQLFKQQGVAIEGIYPMVRGRIIALNKQPIMTAVPLGGRSHNALHRELNLSAMLTYPSDNKIVKGHGWGKQESGKPLISIENNLAADLNLKIGDELTFQIGDQTLSAVISNMRTVNWESFHPNFYVIFPPGLIEQFPMTYITSFYLNGNITFLNVLVKAFPNITIIDVAALLLQMQNILIKITAALQYLFFFALITAILIFVASVLASMDARRQTHRLLRILGASKKYIYKSVAVEFSFLLVLTCLFAFLIARAIIYFLIKNFF